MPHTLSVYANIIELLPYAVLYCWGASYNDYTKVIYSIIQFHCMIKGEASTSEEVGPTKGITVCSTLHQSETKQHCGVPKEFLAKDVSG